MEDNPEAFRGRDCTDDSVSHALAILEKNVTRLFEITTQISTLMYI
jgi:hypothetical protein